MTTIYGGASPSHCHCPPQEPSNPTHASTTMQCGQAVFENDNYRISAGDNNTVAINNKHTGETYQVSGDPHVSVDGNHAFDFWGTTTFQLDDGTKVTLQTTPFYANKDMTLTSKMTVTNGDYGVQVSGIDTNKTGDLKIDEAKGWGRTLDAVVDDGNVLQENPAGKGFLGVDDCGRIHAVDQTYINQTDLQKGGAGALNNQHKDVFGILKGLLSIGFEGRFLHGHGGAGKPHATHAPSTRPAPSKPPAEKSPPFTVQRTNPNQFDPALAGLTRAMEMGGPLYPLNRYNTDMLKAAGGDNQLKNQLVNSYAHSGFIAQASQLTALAASKETESPQAYAQKLAGYAQQYGLTDAQARQQVKTFEGAYNAHIPENNAFGMYRYAHV